MFYFRRDNNALCNSLFFLFLPQMTKEGTRVRPPTSTPLMSATLRAARSGRPRPAAKGGATFPRRPSKSSRSGSMNTATTPTHPTEKRSPWLGKPTLQFFRLVQLIKIPLFHLFYGKKSEVRGKWNITHRVDSHYIIFSSTLNPHSFFHYNEPQKG